MSIISYSTIPSSFETWEFNDQQASALSNFRDFYYPYPSMGGVASEYLNKCVDGTTGQWVYWKTNYKDWYGNEYPGASFSAATYKVQTATYGRQQL